MAKAPQQARSRDSLQRVLEAAEAVLKSEGADAFTMALVAGRAQASVGGIYRRFEGREQLLAAVHDRIVTRLEVSVAAALDAAPRDLVAVVRAFATTISEQIAANGTAFSGLERVGREFGIGERSMRTRQRLAELLRAAVLPHRADVERSGLAEATAMVTRVVLATCVYTARKMDDDELGLADAKRRRRFEAELTDMAVAYLVSPRAKSRHAR